MDQVEFADVVVRNKLNPVARVVQAVRCRVPVGEILGTDRFDSGTPFHPGRLRTFVTERHWAAVQGLPRPRQPTPCDGTPVAGRFGGALRAGLSAAAPRPTWQEGEALPAFAPFSARGAYGFDESCAHEHAPLTVTGR